MRDELLEIRILAGKWNDRPVFGAAQGYDLQKKIRLNSSVFYSY
jgi:hypothetical protein